MKETIEIDKEKTNKNTKRVLIWCFEDIDEEEELINQIKKEMPNANILTFEDKGNFNDYLSKAKSQGVQEIVLITSGSLGQKLEEVIRDNQIITSVLIYCFHVKVHQEWSSKYTKIKCVTDDPDELKNTIISEFSKSQKINSQWKSDMLSNLNLKAGNYFNSNRSCISYIFMDYIYSLFNEKKLSNEQSKRDFIQLCKDNYKTYNGNDDELESIKTAYELDDLEDKIIKLYTDETFFYSMINNLFRTDDYYYLFKLRYPIHLLNKKLNEICFDDKETIPSKLYRGTIIQKKEFEVFRNNIEQSILLTGFVPASSDLSVAEKIIGYLDENYIKVIFAIYVDKDKDFERINLIEDWSACKTGTEYLISNNTVLKFHNIEKTKDYFIINSTFSNSEDNISKYNSVLLDYKKLLEEIRTETNKYNDNYYLLKISEILKIDNFTFKILNNGEKEKENELNAIDYLKYSCYGNLYSRKGEYKKVLEYYEKAMKIRLELLGENHPDTAASNNNNIGSIYYRKGEYEKALEYYGKSLKLRLELYGENHPDIAACNNNIGSIYYRKGDYEKAFKYYENSMKIRLELLGENHPDTAESFKNVANVYFEKGKYAIALEYYEKALKIRIALFGENNIDAAESYNNIADVYTKRAHFAMAMEIYEKSLKIRLTLFGENHQLTRDVYHNIGVVYFSKGNSEKALEYLEKAIQM